MDRSFSKQNTMASRLVRDSQWVLEQREWYRMVGIHSPFEGKRVTFDMSQDRNVPFRTARVVSNLLAPSDDVGVLCAVVDRGAADIADIYLWSLLISPNRNPRDAVFDFGGWQCRQLRAVLQIALWSQWTLLLWSTNPAAVVFVDGEWQLTVSCDDAYLDAVLPSIRNIAARQLDEANLAHSRFLNEFRDCMEQLPLRGSEGSN
jgi:hypothetical protein